MTKDQARNFVNYVATREGVSLNFNPLDLSEEELSRKATIKQERTIDGLLREVPSAKDTFEYEDYKNNPTIGNASELIARAAEMGFGQTEKEKTIGVSEAKNFVEYVAKRPGAVREGAHGLFSSTPNLDLDKIADEVAAYQGRIWRNVISIRREDADKLGYDTQKPWKEAVQQQIDNIARNFHIPPEHLRWYAGMHNTGHHPHIHLFVYSTNPKEGHLNEQGIKNIKRGFSEVIFADERLHIYQQKDEAREELKSQVDELLSHLDLSGSQFPDQQAGDIYRRLLQLGTAVQNQTGRHFYKYLPKNLKQQTDQILTELASAPDIQKLYRLYLEQQQNLERMYVNEPIEIPLTESKELYFLKNQVIQYAEKLAGVVIGIDPVKDPSDVDRSHSTDSMDHDDNASPPTDDNPDNDFSEIPAPSPTDEEDFASLLDNLPPEPESNEPDEAYELPFRERSADEPEPKQKDDISSMSIFELQEKAIGLNGDVSARYELAKRYFYGQGVERDCEKARMWFGLAAESGHILAKYQLGKMYLYGIGIDKDLELGKEFCLEAYSDITYELQEKTGAEIRDDICVPGMDVRNSYYAYFEYLVGRMELAGEGVRQNDNNAFLWFRASALHSHVHSEYMLAKMYHDGRGTVQDYVEALRLYREAADHKDKYACYATGRMYLRGIGCPQNEKAAAAYFTKASRENVPYADFALAQLCETGTGVSTDEAAHILYKKALDEFLEQEKQQPDAFTEYRIAEMYLFGKGTEADPSKSAEWFQKAVESGNPQAAYELAKLYEVGNGVAHDAEKSHELYQTALKGFLASDQENPNAGQEYRIAGMYEQGLGTEVNIQSSVKWYAIAATNGHGHAAYRLGKLYLNGIVVQKDEDAALKWFKKAAEYQDKYAYYALGRMYYNGTGTEKDFARAAQWFQKASEQNIPYADYSLAGMYESGTGVSSDGEKATALYQKSLKEFMEQEKQQPDSLLEYRIASMYLHGKGTDQNPEKAVDWFTKAVEAGNLQAAYELAKLYESGNGVTCDTKKAQKLYQTVLKGSLSSEQENPNAGQEYKIAGMYEKGLGVDADIQKSIKWYKNAYEHGSDLSAYRLGKLYLNGESADKNIKLGIHWLELASQKGIPYADYLLAETYESGRGISSDTKKAQQYYQKSLNEFQKQENEQPDPMVEYKIGKMYLHGNGTRKDSKAASLWFEKAANQGYAHAMYTLAQMQEEGTGIQMDKESTFSLYQNASNKFLEQEKQEPDSMLEYRIASMYLHGKGVEQDLDIAAMWFEKASNSGSPYAAYQLAQLYQSENGASKDDPLPAKLYYKSLAAFLALEKKESDAAREYRIGKMFEYGLGAQIDPEKAAAWYKLAADHGHGYAQYQYSSLCKGTNPLAANRYFHMALQTFLKEEREYANTQREYKIAKMLLQLRDSSAIPQRFDYEQAATQWLEKAANDGNAYAAFEAARLLEQNPYTGSDIETICFYYQLALTGFYDLFSDKTTASETRASLASKIARMYLKGNGTVIQEDEAFRWFSKAAELGDLSAQYQIGKMLLNGTGCDMDGNEAFRVFFDAVKRGNTFAQYQIGKMYEAGIGTAKDSVQSEYWFRTAASNGNEAAQNHLNYLEHQKEYGVQSIVGSLLRMLGSGINDRIEDSTNHRFGPDRKAMKKRRQQKAALGQKEDELDEVM